MILQEVQLIEIEEQEAPQLLEVVMVYLQELGLEDTDYPYLSLYWEEENLKAFWISYNAQNIGFIMVHNYVIDQAFKADHSIAEFYIQAEFRNQGIGKQTLLRLFQHFTKVKWEVGCLRNNIKALKFWQSFIQKMPTQYFHKHELEEAIVFVFTLSEPNEVQY